MTEHTLLTVSGLTANVGDKQILNGIDLVVEPGTVHAIMGPNGSGKSTLGNVLVGSDDYQVEAKQCLYQGSDLLDLSAEERAIAGLFLSFQYPVEIPGVNNLYFLKEALNSKRKAQGLEPVNTVEFMKTVKANAAKVGLPEGLLKRSLNADFSGGEKKRNEILQMLILEPTLAILDETDSGLDIDALKAVADGVNSMRDGKRSFIIITHYQRLLDYIQPDYVHVLSSGRIIKSGDKTLALELEDKGYGWLTAEQGEDVS